MNVGQNLNYTYNRYVPIIKNLDKEIDGQYNR